MVPTFTRIERTERLDLLDWYMTLSHVGEDALYLCLPWDAHRNYSLF